MSPPRCWPDFTGQHEAIPWVPAASGPVPCRPSGISFLSSMQRCVWDMLGIFFGVLSFVGPTYKLLRNEAGEHTSSLPPAPPAFQLKRSVTSLKRGDRASHGASLPSRLTHGLKLQQGLKRSSLNPASEGASTSSDGLTELISHIICSTL